ncbi:MAG TPA: hypothetical protein VJN95_18310 [Gemmatimonadales bacterium]|nr:hypothetical protein [Gemmatimonadales bacterium]
MNEHLKQRIQRKLEELPDERGYQVLDFVEFLESRYAARQAPSGILARITETVEDTLRAGKLPMKAVGGAMSAVDGASKVMKGIAAAGKAAVDEAIKVTGSMPATGGTTPPTPPAPPASGPSTK